MAIRPAKEADLLRIIRLYVELVSYHHALDARYGDAATAQREAERVVLDWVTNSRGRVLVAEENGQVVGFITGFLQKPHMAVAPVSTGRLDVLAVTERYRGRGIGTALTQSLLDWFRLQGVQRVFVSTAAHNSGASAFWVRMGFADFSVTRSLDLVSPENLSSGEII